MKESHIESELFEKIKFEDANKPKDIHAIEIILDVIENVVSRYNQSTNLTFGEFQIIFISESILPSMFHPCQK